MEHRQKSSHFSLNFKKASPIWLWDRNVVKYQIVKFVTIQKYMRQHRTILSLGANCEVTYHFFCKKKQNANLTDKWKT